MTERLLNVEFRGLRDVQGRFTRLTNALGDIRREELRQLGRDVVETLRGEAPVRTGKLRAGIHFLTGDSGGAYTLRVYSSAPYTKWVLEGRGPVEAKRAKALRFEPGPPGSGYIYRRRVGPAKANPFHRRAFAKLGGAEAATVRRMAGRIEQMWERG